MSADEIRKIALGKVPMHYKQASDGFVVLDDLVVRTALLAYADMVERCEKLKFNMIPHRRDAEIVDYILRGDAGKEER